MDRDASNRSRYSQDDPGGHYESYFVRANHPQRALAFWIRYTVFSPKGHPGEAVGELWAIHFDGERQRITAVKQTAPLQSCVLSRRGLDVRMGNAALTDGELTGRSASHAHSIQWQLRYRGSQPPLLLLPQSFYESRFPKAKALVGTPHAIFDGNLVVDGDTVDVAGWVGSHNHNWGRKHTDSYAWGQVAGFDNAPDVFLECSTARLKLGPVWSPPLTVVVLRMAGREIRLNSLAQAFRARGHFDFTSWQIESVTSRARVAVHIRAPRWAFVGLNYANPPGGTKMCLNTKLAACELVLQELGQPKRTFLAQHRAAFEILTERQDHGIPIAA